ncbi:MAG: hypothetical protein V3R13_05500 [Nitrososphaerales archaeon]
MSGIDQTVKALGDGTVVTSSTGQYLFKLSSFGRNPVVKPRDIGLTWYENDELQVGAVFNGGAELLEGNIILTPRCHRGYQKAKFLDERLGIDRVSFEKYVSEIWPMVSEDGIHFARLKEMVIRGDGTDQKDFVHGLEDMRIIKYGERYLLIGCGKVKPPFQGGNGDRIAVYSTKNFLQTIYHGIVDSFDSRNVVSFPEPILGKVYMLLRFHPNIHIDSLENGLSQLLKPSQHLESWNEIYNRRSENLLLKKGRYPHETEKIGVGPPPIKTERGWLLIYHAVGEIDEDICRVYGLSQKINRGYSICAAILDIRDPTKVLCRSTHPIYVPSATWELYGDETYPIDVPAVVFPVGAVVWKDKLLLYCGSGDKYVVLLSCSLRSLIEYLWSKCRSK